MAMSTCSVLGRTLSRSCRLDADTDPTCRGSGRRPVCANDRICAAEGRGRCLARDSRLLVAIFRIEARPEEKWGNALAGPPTSRSVCRDRLHNEVARAMKGAAYPNRTRLQVSSTDSTFRAAASSRASCRATSRRLIAPK